MSGYKHHPSSADSDAIQSPRPPTTGEHSDAFAEPEVPLLASRGRRLANVAVDGFIFSYALDELTVLSSDDGLIAVMIGLVYLLTWALPEAMFGRTVGKFVTGTKVVDLQGGQVSLSQVFLRTLIRLVPFEALSLLWGETIAWHDAWTKTRVVLMRDPSALATSLTQPGSEVAGYSEAGQTDLEEDEAPYPAGLGRRFANLVIDAILFWVLVFGTVSMLTFEQLSSGVVLLAYPLVWTLPELLFGRTLGKLLTGTKVVNLQGERPSFTQVCVRTIVRGVPFDAWSFLWGDNVGWHDSWVNTRVVLVRNPYEDIE